MNFLKNDLRFSFVYGEKNFEEYVFCKEQQVEDNRVTSTYLLEDGLKITNIAKKYTEFDAYEWVNYFENTGTADSKIISSLWDCDCMISCDSEEPSVRTSFWPSREEVMQIYAPFGYDESEFVFYSRIDEADSKYPSFLFPGKSKEYRNKVGLSSEFQAPYFNIHQKGKGVVMAVGWTGQWNSKFTRNRDTLRLQSKIEDTHFYLHPGEKIRTSSVVIMRYEGSFLDGQNKWRRLLLKNFFPITNREKFLPLCVQFWGGQRSDEIIKRLDLVEQYHIPVEYVWVDAGWFGHGTEPSISPFQGDWAEHTGDWVVSTNVHPQEMQDVVEKVRDINKKFLLWIEPERVVRGTPITKEHPEYFIDDPNETYLLLNLGNPQAFQYCLETISGLIEKLNISCYRQDCNFGPLNHWRSADTNDRRGITEIKHIMGLYQLWDCLLQRFPHLIIDNVAGGGTRLDIEACRRSVPLWRSDVQCSDNYKPEIAQIHNINYSLWLPWTGSCSGQLYSTYCARSAYASGYTVAYLNSEPGKEFAEDPKKMEWLRGICEEYLKVRPYFWGDIYPLTEPLVDDTAWCVIQWNRPENRDGMIQLFKHKHSSYTEAVFFLKGIDDTKEYLIVDMDGGEYRVSGRELNEKGFCVRITEKCVSKIYFYQCCSE